MALLDPPFLFEGWCVSGRTGSRWRSPCRPPSTACSLLPTAKKQPAKNLNRGNLKHKMTKKQWCCWKILSSQGDQGGSRWRSFATSTARKTASQKLFIIWRSSCRTASLNGMYGHWYAINRWKPTRQMPLIWHRWFVQSPFKFTFLDFCELW